MDRKGYSALHYALTAPMRDETRKEIVTLLIKHGAHPGIPDLEGRSPLHLAAANDFDIIALYRELNKYTKHVQNAWENLQDNDHNTPQRIHQSKIDRPRLG